MATISLTLSLILLLVGCGAANSESSAPSERADPSAAAAEVEGVDEFRAALDSRGLAVEEAGSASLFFLSPPAVALRVEAGDLQLFEYPDAAAAGIEAARISPDGFKVEITKDGATAATDISWLAPPHFYRQGRLIVLYLGDDPIVLETLEAILGRPFAGG